MRNELTLTKFIGALAADVIKFFTAIGGVWGALKAISAFATTTVAVGPILVSLVLGTFLTITFHILDKDYAFADWLISMTIKLAELGRNGYDNLVALAKKAGRAVNNFTIGSCIAISKAININCDYITDLSEDNVLTRAWDWQWQAHDPIAAETEKK
jgi:hypothetical protein